MSIVCQYDQLKYPFFVGDVSRQISVETKLRLAESLPKLGTIIGGDFQTGSPVFTVNDDLILISGKVYPHLLFRAEMPEERKHNHHKYDSSDEDGHDEEQKEFDLPQEYGVSWHGENGINFEELIEVPGLRPEMLVQVEVIPLKGVFEKEGPDLVFFRGRVELIVRTAYHQTAGIVNDINMQSPDKINIIKERVFVEELMDTKKVLLPIQSNLMLSNFKPGVARILKVLVKPIGICQEVVRNRLFVRGSLDVSIVYVGSDDEGNPTDIFANEWSREAGSAISFETHIDLDDKDGEILALPRVMARDILVEPRTPHEMHCLMNLEFEVRISRIYQKEMVVDTTPSEGELIDTQKYLFNMEEYSGEVTGEIELDQQIELPGNLPRIDRILTYYGTPREIIVEASEGKILIEGNLDLWLMYITDEAIERKLQIATLDKATDNKLPLAGILESPDLKPGMMLRTHMMIDSLKVEMSGGRKLKLSGEIKVRVLSRTPRAIFILKDCMIVVPVDPNTRPSMLFYVVQQEDTLWKIARRYQTTVETLVKANQIINRDDIEVGQKLLIPKRIVNM